MEKPEKLTAKQETFCQEYLIDSNATQAAIRAGYAENSAQEQRRAIEEQRQAIEDSAREQRWEAMQQRHAIEEQSRAMEEQKRDAKFEKLRK